MQTGFTIICEPVRDDIRGFDANTGGEPAGLSVEQNDDGWALFWGSLFYHPAFEHRQPAGSITPAAAVWSRFSAKDLGGVASLEGEFVLVLRDRLRNRTIAMRDPLGSYPLFWARKGGTFIVGTALNRIQRRLSSNALNQTYVAAYFSSPAPFNEIPGRQCALEGVQRVLPGTMVVFDHVSRRVDERRYWDWRSRLTESPPRRGDDDGAIYLQTLRAAVAQRLGKATAAHCSGGMDSSAVALLAGDLLQRQPDPKRLTTISLVYDRLRELAGDTPFLDTALAAGKGAFDPHLLHADTLLDFDGFADAPLHDEPYPGLWRLGLDRATITAAADQGADTLLTGLGADEVFDQQPFHLADLLRRHRLRRAWREATRWALADNCNPWEFITACGWHPAIAAGDNWLARVGGHLGGNGHMQLPEWLRSSFVRRYQLRERFHTNIRSIYTGGPTTPLSVALDAIRARQGDFNRWYLGLPMGVTISHPFLDPRVIVSGLSLIGSRPPEPGRMKPLLADALKPVLPKPIVERRRKGHFNEVYYQGLARNEATLQKLVSRAGIEPFIDKQKLSEAIALAALGGLGVNHCRHLNLALCFAHWFAHGRLAADRPDELIYRIDDGPSPNGPQRRRA
jgi:asparagine synthase (glutamine-hydrolysing)